MKGGEVEMATYRYIRASGIRALVKEHKKQCGADFLNEIDKFVYEKIMAAIKQFNGHCVRLDSAVAKVVLKEIRV